MDLQGAKINGGALLNRNSTFKFIDLAGANIIGQLSFASSKIRKTLNLEAAKIKGNLLLSGEGKYKSQFGDIILGYTKIEGPVILKNAIIEKTINGIALEVTGDVEFSEGTSIGESLYLTDAQIAGSFFLDGIKIQNDAIMSSLEIGQSLLLGYGAEFQKVDLRSSKIGNQLSMVGVSIKNELILSGAQIGGDMLCSSSKFHGDKQGKYPTNLAIVHLLGVTVNNQVSFRGANVSNKLNMEAAVVGGELWLDHGTFLNDVILSRADLSKIVSFESSEIKGLVDLTKAKIGGDVLLSGATLKKDLLSTLAVVESDLILTEANVQSIDLTDAIITRGFKLGERKKFSPSWGKDAKLILRNAHVGVIQDNPEAWPNYLDLTGFTYSGLGGSLNADGTDMANRSISWFVGWLARQPYYSTQPYIQLANVLSEHGQADKAQDVLYQSRNRERRQAQNIFFDKIWLTMLWLVIGYGYRTWYSIVWGIILIAIGAFVYRMTPQGRKNTWLERTAYSFDLFMPIIRLRERHYQVDLPGWPRYYFYVHQLMGLILITFLAAGLSGLTK